MKISQVYELNERDYLKKKDYLISLGKFVTNSTQTETIADASVIPESRHRDMVVEILHLDLGPKAVHCLIKKLEGVRKRKAIYEFCYHYRGFCPHTKPVALKRKDF